MGVFVIGGFTAHRRDFIRRCSSYSEGSFENESKTKDGLISALEKCHIQLSVKQSVLHNDTNSLSSLFSFLLSSFCENRNNH